MERDWLDDLLAKVDIVKIVERYVSLSKKGDNYVGFCPFHHERTGSFSVSSSRQFYHCFGCKESGDVISFLRKIESISFFDSVKLLCRELGIEVPDRQFNENDSTDYNVRKKLYAVLKDAAIKYHHNLNSTEGQVVKKYLYSRGLDDKTIAKFGLGVSISSSVLEYLQSKGHSIKDISLAGIANKSKQDGIKIAQDDKYYDVFYDRLTIPIINALGEVVGFGARDYKDKQGVAKYRNSWQSIIFDKSSVVFGINNIRSIKQTRSVQFVLLVEGYMDVVSLASVGIDNAVACMGTALSYRQARLIKNYTDAVYVCFDGDTAGQSATMKSLDILSSVGLTVKVVKLPQGLDPDDYIKEHSKDSFDELISDADTVPAYKIKSLLANTDLSDSSQRQAFAIRASSIVASLEGSVVQEEYRRLVAKLSGYSEAVLQSQERESSKDIQHSSDEQPFNKDSGVAKNKDLQFVLASLLQDKDWCDFGVDIVKFLPQHYIPMYQYAVDRHKQSLPMNPAVLYNTINTEYHQELTEILSLEFEPGDNQMNFDNIINKLYKDYYEPRRRSYLEQYYKEYENTKDSAILKKMGDIERYYKEAKSTNNYTILQRID